jgi:hypothetical protein
MGIGAADVAERPVDANADISRIADECPSGQAIGSSASAIGRRASKRVSHVRHRYS